MEKINFCQECAGKIIEKIPANETHLRAVCSVCGLVHYKNPRIVVCTISVDKENNILLAKRDIEPRRHYWTLPGGFLELNETPDEGAKRETEEETYCKVDIIRPFSIITTTSGEQVHMFYLANIKSFSNKPTTESEEVKMFAVNAIPWNDLSFRTVIYTLELFKKHPQHLGVFCGRVLQDYSFNLSIK